MFSKKSYALAACASAMTPFVANAQQVPNSPPVGFTNSTSAAVGTVLPQLLDSYKSLIRNNPDVLIQNYRTVVTLTQARTDAQTLKAVHDDRTAQPYSVMNGLGALTSYYLTGAGASLSGVTPQALTSTSYASATLADYAANINTGNAASAGIVAFANGSATPLASAVSFINGTVRANSSTEPAKRTFERDGVPVPLDARYNDYNVLTARGKLTTADTAGLVVPSYLSRFTTPAPYADTSAWVKGFTVTQAMVDANGGRPITAPGLGSYNAAGVFTAATFAVGDYVPGVGTSPRPFRVSADVAVPTLLRPIVNTTNPYADGAFPSGHTNSGTLQALGVAFLVPQQAQELLARAADLGNDRILAGMHSPLDVIGGRIEATAIAATNIYAALYDAKGNRLDWTNPANTGAYAVYQAYTQTQAYLASACGTATVSGCITAANRSGASASDPYGDAAANRAAYTAELTYGFKPVGAVTPLTAAQVPVQAQVLLMTRFPYLSDAQRTDVLATTGLPSGYPALSGNTWDGWGQLNLYAAMDGYGAFTTQAAVTMDAAQGSYSAADAWNNDISGTGGLTKNGNGVLTLTGRNSYAGPTIVNAGGVFVTGTIVSPTTVNGGTFGGAGSVGSVAVNTGGTLMPGMPDTPGTLTVNGALTLAAGSTWVETVTATSASRIAVSGQATLGGTLQMQGAPTAQPVVRVVLIDAAGGVTGNFGSITTGNASLRAVADYGATSVALNLNRTDVSYLPLAQTANQRATAAALTAGVAGARSADAATLLNALYATGAASAPAGAAALDRLGGEGLADAGSAALFAGKTVMDAAAYEQLTTLKAGGLHLWGGPIGGREWIDGRVGTADVRANTVGGLIGLDGEVAPGWRAGFFGGGLSTHGDTPARITSSSISSGHVGAYTSITSRTGAYARAALAYGHYAFHTHRSAGGIGQIVAAQENGRFDGSEIRVGGEIGQSVTVRTLDVTPFVGIDYARLGTDAFTESGGGALALRGDGHAITSLPLSAGLRLAQADTGGNGVRPYLEVTYRHELQRDRDLGLAFAALDDSGFAIAGARPAADAVAGKLGVEAQLAGRLSLFANGSGTVSSAQRAFTGNGGIRLPF